MRLEYPGEKGKDTNFKVSSEIILITSRRRKHRNEKSRRSKNNSTFCSLCTS